jgi:hypothetical protein
MKKLNLKKLLHIFKNYSLLLLHKIYSKILKYKFINYHNSTTNTINIKN